MSQEKKFYVYVHRYASGPKMGHVFYVGKGSGKRIRDKTNRNRYWKYITSKYGYTYEIAMTFSAEECAFSFEAMLVSYYGFSSLCNMTNGGDGVRGLKSKRRKVVYCSNGMVFKSVTKASKWIDKPSALSGIAAACAGKRQSAYGLLWSYEKVPVGNANIHGNPRPIACSNGMIFNSVSDAAKYLSPKCVSINIIHAAMGKRKSAYGFTWRFVD